MKLATILFTRRQVTASRMASIVLATAALILTSTGAHAGGGTWGQTTIGTYAWTATSDWSGGNVAGSTGANATSTGDTSTATFGNITASNVVTVDSYRNLQQLIFNGNGTSGYTFIGGPLNLTGGGSISNLTTGSGTTFFDLTTNLEGNATFNSSGVSALDFGINNSTFGGAIIGVGVGTYTLNLTGTYAPESANNYYQSGFSFIDSTIGQTNATTVLGVTKSGTGTWAIVSQSNTYSGTTTIDGGILNVDVLANEGTASSIGTGSKAVSSNGVGSAGDLVFNGGILQYTGTGLNTATFNSGNAANNQGGQFTNRLFTIGDSTGTGTGTAASPYTAQIDSSDWLYNQYNTASDTISFTNTGAIAFSDAGTGGIGSNTGPGNTYHSLTLSGANLGNNYFDPQLLDDSGSSGSAPTSLVKTGAGTWILGNSNSYSGGTTISGGTLGDVTGSGVSQNGLLTINNGVYAGPGGGNFTRTLGSTGTDVQITGGQAGFSAYGGAATLNIGNNGSTLKFGTATFNPGMLILNNQLANNTLAVTNGFDLNGATRTIETFANSANTDIVTINGSIINSSANVAGLDKAGSGVLRLTASNSYNGLTGIEGGILWSSATGALGTNTTAINVAPFAELRIDAATDMPGTVLLNRGILGINFNGTQSTVNGLLASGSTGAIALDTTDTNNFNMGTLGNGSLFLGSSTANGVYGGTALTAAGGGTEPYSSYMTSGAVLTNYGGVYRLGGGGGTLTFTNANVVTDQTVQYNLLNNPYTLQNLNTSNNYNSVVIGDGGTFGQPNGGGTVDFQNKQNYDGLTTINAGYTLNLDFSNTNSKVTSNILNSTNIVNLNGGTLEVTNGISNTSSPTTYSQTLGGLNTFGGANTVAINDTGTGAVTVDLGALNSTTVHAGNNGLYASNNGTAMANLPNVNMSTGSTVLFDVTGTSGTATFQTTTAPGVDGTTLGGQYVYENGNTGVYTWTSATTSAATGAGIYNLGAYTGDTTVLPASLSSSTTDYIITAAGTTTLGVNESINLLRANNSGAATITTAANKALTANGILFDGPGSLTIGGGQLSVGNSGTLDIYNYQSTNNTLLNTIYNPGTNTGLLTIGGITGTGNVVFGGNGVINLNGFVSNTGNVYLDGATLALNTGNTGTFAMTGNSANGTGLLVINSGALSTYGVSSSGYGLGNISEVWNGNFSLLHNSEVNGGVGYNVLMTNNITITVNNSLGGGWTYNQNIGDGGYGYGLTISGNSQNPSNPGGTALNSTFILGGTNTFTGPITVLADSIGIGGLNPTNRFNVLSLGSNTAVTFGPGYVSGEGNYVLAGLTDAGIGNNTSTLTGNYASTLYLDGGGSYSYGGGDIQGSGLALVEQGAGGTQILTGTNSFSTGYGITINAGTLNFDGSKGGVLQGTPALVMRGGTLEYEGSAGGGSLNFNTTNSSFGAGNSTVIANAAYGNTTINFGNVSPIVTGGTLLIDEIGTNGTDTVTTQSTALNAPNAHVVFTQGGTTSWGIASTSGGSPYTFSAYTGDTTALLTTGASSATNYSITSATAQTQTASESAGLLRITDTNTGGSWDLNGKTLQINSSGILFTGTSAYTIKDTPGTGVLVGGSSDKELIIQNYGSAGAPLTISSIIGNSSATVSDALVISGTGNTVLTNSNTYSGGTYLNGGVTTISKLASVGTSQIYFAGGTLQYATGFSGVNGTTSGGDLATTSGTLTRQVNIGAAGATIDTNGNTITFGATSGASQQLGQGSTSSITAPGGVTYVDSANANSGGQGVLNFNATANYNGASTIGSGGVVNLGGAANSGVMNTPGGTIVASGGTLEGGTTQSTSAAQITTSAYAGKITVQSGGNLVVGAPNATLSTALNAVDTNGNIATDGNNKLNVLEAAQLTWQAGGTLSFKLSSTGNEGSSVVSPSSSTQLNLGTGALVKSGTGQFILNFENTGSYYNNGNSDNVVSPNVYDLINFGLTDSQQVSTSSTLNYSIGPNGDTNFTIDDFTIENLDGSGVLSFYYNSNADGGVGQEELILTMVPEPSTWAMLIGGLATLIFWTRRKRAAARSFVKKP